MWSGSWMRQATNGSGTCKIVSSGEEVPLDEEEEHGQRCKWSQAWDSTFFKVEPYFPNL